MNKYKRRTVVTIGFMILFAVIILMVYYYLSNRVTPLTGLEGENLSETEKILAVDLEYNYPETPREVVKLFARIMKSLYHDPENEDVEPLALKIRELYDVEFLENNPEDTYLTNLKTDIAEWKENNRSITNYILVNKELEQTKEIDGINYSVVYVSYTIQKNKKFTETWKILLRQDENKEWKILGWEYAPDTSKDAD